MNVEKYNHQEKKQKYQEQKKELVDKLGPGAYINP